MSMIHIDTKNIINTISPTLYGVFFEDINYGGDGGLYAELIPNRSFEYYSIDGMTDRRKMRWEAVGGAEFEIASDTPLNSVHKNYASVAGGAGGGIRSLGYGGDGFAVHSGEAFDLSLYASSDNAAVISALITDKNGTVLGSARIDVPSGNWTKHERRITVNGSSKNAYLQIVLEHEGSVKLEFISLFPSETFMMRKNGMRRDIAEMIADMKPSFMRFPGGCIVESRSYEDMYNWKDTIGPVEERKTNRNRWQLDEYQHLGFDSSDYFQSYGIGFYEYFLFCEDIGAKPVPVINCGMTCQWHEALLVDTDKLKPYIQDALDLIEFANGDGTGKWSRIRQEMGHEKPFGLEYIGIGNEQWGHEYFERYELFQKRIREEYPEIKLITSAGWKNRGWEFDLAYDWMSKNKDKAYAVDEHFYKEPEWFLNNINRYDGYDRTLPKVFIGEWAAHTSPDIKGRHNNQFSAIAEAAFLTGVERNADHVIMTAYAPLLAKCGHQQWQPNLIWFDNERVYGTPNYYVQKMFSHNIGDYAVMTSCDDDMIKCCASVKDNVLIVKLVNISDTEKYVDIASDITLGTGAVTELCAAPHAKNTADLPRNVFPLEKTVIGTYRISPYSAAVIRYSIT